MNIGMDWTQWLSTWGVLRAAGLTAYVLVFISVTLGAFSYGEVIPTKIRKKCLPIHKMTGWFGFLFALLHCAVLLIDQYEPFSLDEIMIPFTSDFHPLTVGLGTITLYILTLLLVSSDFVKKLGRKVWKSIHLLSYPMFFFLLVHGIFDGTDAEEIWAFFLYSLSAIIFAIVVVIRGYLYLKKGGYVENLTSGR